MGEHSHTDEKMIMRMRIRLNTKIRMRVGIRLRVKMKIRIGMRMKIRMRMRSDGDRTEWSTIQGKITRVISNRLNAKRVNELKLRI